MNRTVGPPARLLAAATSTSLATGERAPVFGGIVLPKGTYDLALWECNPKSCRRTSLVKLHGPDTYWGQLGTEAGPLSDGNILLRLYRTGPHVTRIVGGWSERDGH